MSTYSVYPIDYSQPRTIWTLSFQLFYTVLAMIPFYYYMRNVLEIPPEGRFVIQLLPIAVAVLIFFMQLRWNIYFWRDEKIYKRRDIFVISLKSMILSLGVFYFSFLLIFSYWMGGANVHEEWGFENPIEVVMLNATFSLVLLLLVLVFMIAIQEDRLVPRKITARMRRKG